MPNARLMPYNHHDDATLSLVGGATAADYFLSNTQDKVRSNKWRSTITATQTIRGTLAASKTADFFGLFYHNAHGADVKLELFSDAAWVTSVYSSGTLPLVWWTADSTYDWGVGNTDPNRPNAPFRHWFSPVTFRSYEVTFSGTSTLGIAWQLARLWLARSFEFGLNPAVGATLGRGTNSERNRLRGGGVRTNAGASWKTRSYDLSWMRESDRAVWMDVMEYNGTHRDVVFSMFPENGTRLERDEMLNGVMTSLDAIGRQVSWLTKRVQLEEV